jgi:uncharacterized Zn finger protein
VTRESVEAKAARYVTAGRLIVTEVVPGGRVRATCRGGGALYELGFDRGVWWCTCPARGASCSHLLALGLVVVQPRRPES